MSSKPHPKPAGQRSLSKAEKRRQKRAQRRARDRTLNRELAVNDELRGKLAIDRDAAAGNAITQMMMLPAESSLVRLPTADAPPVSICKLKQTYDARDRSGQAGFGGNTYVNILYGQPGLTHMDGPWINTAAYDCQMMFAQTDREVAQNGESAIPSLEWNLGIVETGVGETTPEAVGTDPIRGIWNQPSGDGDPPVPDLTVRYLVDGQLHEARSGGTDIDLDDWWPLARTNQPTQVNRLRPILMHEGVPYVWMNYSEQLHVVGGTAVASGGSGFGWLSVHRLQDEDSRPIMVCRRSFTFGYTSISPVVLGWFYSGWYAVKAEGVTIYTGRVTHLRPKISIKAQADCPEWRLHYFPDAKIFDVCRRTAFSCLVSNRTSALVAQGNILAGRLPAKFPDENQRFRLFEELETSTDYYTGPAAKGCYSYMEFTHQDEEFSDPVNLWGNPLVRLPEGRMMNVITCYNAQAENVYSITYTMVLEFQSHSQLFPRAVSLLPYEDLIRARRINNMTVYFYENSLHWKDLREYILKMWSWSRKHGTLLGTAASMFFPEASPAIMPIA